VSTVLAAAGLSAVRVLWFPFAPKELAAFYASKPDRRGYLWRSAATLAGEFGVGNGVSPETHFAASPAAAISIAGEGAWTTG
jgi:hypothetical protein